VCSITCSALERITMCARAHVIVLKIPRRKQVSDGGLGDTENTGVCGMRLIVNLGVERMRARMHCCMLDRRCA
jgi:hypothetical protein